MYNTRILLQKPQYCVGEKLTMDARARLMFIVYSWVSWEEGYAWVRPPPSDCHDPDPPSPPKTSVQTFTFSRRHPQNSCSLANFALKLVRKPSLSHAATRKIRVHSQNSLLAKVGTRSQNWRFAKFELAKLETAL